MHQKKGSSLLETFANCVYIYIHTYIDIYVCVCVYIYVYIYIYTLHNMHILYNIFPSSSHTVTSWFYCTYFIGLYLLSEYFSTNSNHLNYSNQLH